MLRYISAKRLTGRVAVICGNDVSNGPIESGAEEYWLGRGVLDDGGKVEPGAGLTTAFSRFSRGNTRLG